MKKKKKKKKKVKENKEKKKEKLEESPRKYHFSGLLFGLIIKILMLSPRLLWIWSRSAAC